MARVSDNWERLVRATLKREQIRASCQGHERIPSGIAGAVPPSLGKATNIDAILQAADAIQAEDANVSRILWYWIGASPIVTISVLHKIYPFLGCLKQLAITWKRIVKSLGLWDSVREFARMYDAGMGMLIFSPIAFLSWFPFISTFQSRLLFNQAFSRGLEISVILAGNKANVDV